MAGAGFICLKVSLRAAILLSFFVVNILGDSLYLIILTLDLRLRQAIGLLKGMDF